MAPRPEQIVRIIREREHLIDKVPEDFIKSLERSQRSLLNEILDYVKELETTSGKIKNIPPNVQMAIRMRDEIRTWLRKSGYYTSVEGFGKEYEQLKGLARDFYSVMDLPSAFSQRDLQALSKFKADDLAFLLKNDDRVINATYNLLLDSVHQSRSFSDLTNRMRRLQLGTSEGDVKIAGLLKRYGGTYSATAFASFDRRIQMIKANELDLDHFLFSGGLIKDSRTFCRLRAGQVFTRKQVESWAKLSWKGKISDADIFVVLGGWNCQHILSPVTNDLDFEELQNIYSGAQTPKKPAPSTKTTRKPRDGDKLRKQLAKKHRKPIAAVRKLDAELTAIGKKMEDLRLGKAGDLQSKDIEGFRKKNDELLELAKKMSSLKAEQRKKRRDLARLMNKELVVNTDSVLNVKISSRNSDKLIRKWRAGVEEFSRLVRSDLLDGLEGKIRKDRSGRAFYRPGEKAVFLNAQSDAGVAIHELGHFLEDSYPDIHRRLVDFYSRRTKNEQLSWLGPGYGRNEVTKVDKFIDPYMGKYYFTNGEQVATELLSMGLEYLYRDPLKLMDEDSELFDFIIGLVQ